MDVSTQEFFLRRLQGILVNLEEADKKTARGRREVEALKNDLFEFIKSQKKAKAQS
jgi:hypothetical protein